MPTPDRTRARALAAEAMARGDAVGWFEELYREAEAGDAVVPWADLEPNPFLAPVVEGLSVPAAGRALVVGCGFGDDAALLDRLGWSVTAFDVSPTCVRSAAERYPDLDVDWQVADVVSPPRAWQGAFDLVHEAYTVQVLPPGSPERAAAVAAIASTVAPGGVLAVVARARDDAEPPAAFPWPLTRAEVTAFAESLEVSAVDLALDRSEEPPVGRWVATFRRP